MQAVYTCLIVFADRCAVVRIKFTLFGFYRFHVAQYSVLQLLPPSAHIPCTLLVCLVCRISHNICNSDILSEVQTMCESVLIIAHGKLVAFDTPERLEKALTQTNKVELSTEASEKEVWEILSDISEVTSLVIKEAESGLTGVSLTLDASDPVGVCRRIFFAFAHAQRAVIQMTPVKADLEDIFIELTESDAPVGTSGKHRRT